jgi:DNA polymerase III subunit epsilon
LTQIAAPILIAMGDAFTMNFVALDFETANYSRASACSVGLVKVENGKITDKIMRLIRPPSRDFVFTHIHGLTWADVSEAGNFSDVWSEVSSILDGADFLAAHNSSFDKGVLNACCAHFSLDTPSLPFQCSMKLARKNLGIYPTKLSDVCRRLNIELEHHEALSDALACAQIILAAQPNMVMSTPEFLSTSEPSPFVK